MPVFPNPMDAIISLAHLFPIQLGMRPWPCNTTPKSMWFDYSASFSFHRGKNCQRQCLHMFSAFMEFFFCFFPIISPSSSMHLHEWICFLCKCACKPLPQYHKILSRFGDETCIELDRWPVNGNTIYSREL